MPFDSTPLVRPGKPARYVRYTGHPPPERQIANQVRSSSGVTFGRATADGARLYALPSRLTGFGSAPSQLRAALEEALPADRSCRELLGALLDLERAGTKLPGCEALAGILGDDWNAQRVRRGLDALADAGHIVQDVRHRDRALKIRGSDVVLRTKAYGGDLV